LLGHEDWSHDQYAVVSASVLASVSSGAHAVEVGFKNPRFLDVHKTKKISKGPNFSIFIRFLKT